MILIHSAADIETILKDRTKEKLYIVGAGSTGRILGKYLNKANICWTGYYDKTPPRESICGRTVKKYDEIEKNDNDFYLISSYGFKDLLIKELIARGVNDRQIVCFAEYDTISEIYEELENISMYLSKIAEFKGIHEGEKCFIIGNGPSLSITDLEKLKDIICFSCNSIYALFDHTSWRPTYYFATDPLVNHMFASDEGLLTRICSSCDKAFMNIKGELLEKHAERMHSNIYYVKLDSKYTDDKLPLFSGLCDKCIYIGGTVVYYCMQMAVYMGFKEIYLLGVDCGGYAVDVKEDGKLIKTDGISHQVLIEKEEEKYYSLVHDYFGYNTMSSTFLHINAYKSAKKYCDSHGVKIYNATRGGELEVFPRVNFNNVI